MEVITPIPSQELPTVLIVQGCFQTPSRYEKLVDSLASLGHPTVHPRLPSCSGTDHPDFPKTTLVDDALAIRLELTRQVEYEGKFVVVAMHSYGGLVGSEAIPEELGYAKRQSLGLPGGVIHLFYYCAFILNEGQSVLSAFGESPNNDVRVRILRSSLIDIKISRLTVSSARRPLLLPGRGAKAVQRSPSVGSVAVGLPPHPTVVQSTGDEAHPCRLAIHTFDLSYHRGRSGRSSTVPRDLCRDHQSPYREV